MDRHVKTINIFFFNTDYYFSLIKLNFFIYLDILRKFTDSKNHYIKRKENILTLRYIYLLNLYLNRHLDFTDISKKRVSKLG